MRRFLLLCCAAALAGCSQPREQAGGGISLADLAGTWNMEALAETTDSVVVTYQMSATASTEGWTMTLPGQDPVPLSVMVHGDSLMLSAGPFPSVLRPGVMVATEYMSALVGGRLLGTVTAHYTGAGPDSLVRFRLRGAKFE